MRARLTRIVAVVFAVIVMLCCFVLPASALDDTYTFDEFGMSIKFPKNFLVITRDTPRGSEVFDAVDLGYDETMTAFHAADIYLRAYDPDLTYHISLTLNSNESSEAVHNYAELTAAQRKAITDTLLSDESVSTVTEVKRNGNIFIDTERELEIDDSTVAIHQSSSVINGIQIDLALQKEDGSIMPDEAKTLNNAVSSITFDKITATASGPRFDWWRLALWFLFLAAISVTVSVIYKRHNEATKARMEARRIRRMSSGTPPEDEEQEDDEQMTFDEALGYSDDEEFASRAAADEMASIDINVRERDPNKGVGYFEDGGDGIDDGSDYFDTYFKEPVEERTPLQRFFSTCGAYIKIAATHTGYFFKNLYLKIVGGIKNLINKIRKK